MKFFYLCAVVLASSALVSCADIIKKSDATFCSEEIGRILKPRWHKESAVLHQKFKGQALTAKVELRIVWLDARPVAMLTISHWKAHSENPEFDTAIERFVNAIEFDTKVLVKEERECSGVYPWEFGPKGSNANEL